MDDRFYMQMALEMAENGRGYTSPNPLVGAVVANGHTIVGKGWHQRAGGPHAEVYALDQAGARAEGATLYVTLEPCNHYGRTPPCTEKIIAAGIRRVVIAAMDPNPAVTGGGARYLEDVHQECKRLGLGEVVDVLGRFWSLDREHNWDRIEKTYRLLVDGVGQPVPEDDA